MSRVLLFASVMILALHGLVHLMGTTVYMRLGRIQGLTYKTTLIGGHWDLGDTGIAVFGAFLLLAAFGFLAASAGLLAGWNGSACWLAAIAALSLLLTLLDWEYAFMGAIVNVVILMALWLGSRLYALFPN